LKIQIHRYFKIGTTPLPVAEQQVHGLPQHRVPQSRTKHVAVAEPSGRSSRRRITTRRRRKKPTPSASDWTRELIGLHRLCCKRRRICSKLPHLEENVFEADEEEAVEE
jgi:hypothetical protein